MTEEFRRQATEQIRKMTINNIIYYSRYSSSDELKAIIDEERTSPRDLYDGISKARYDAAKKVLEDRGIIYK